MGENADTLRLHGFVQGAPQIHVEAAEDLGAAIDQRRLDAKAVEDVGEFDGDVAAAADGDRLRQFRQVKGLVGGDAMFVAGQCAVLGRAAAGGDQDLVGGDGAVLRLKPDRVAVDQRGTRLQGFAAGALHILAVETFEPGDLAILVGDQGRPVEACLRHGPAIASRVLEMFGKLRGVDEQLLGNAAADDAGAAETVFLGDADLLAEGRRDAGRAHPAGTAADDEEVVVVSAHGWFRSVTESGLRGRRRIAKRKARLSPGS